MPEKQNKLKDFLVGTTCVTDIEWKLCASGFYNPRIKVNPISYEKDKIEREASSAPGWSLSYLKKNGISKGCIVEIYACGAQPDYIYVKKVVEKGSGDFCLPENTLIQMGGVWNDTENTRKYLAFDKSMKGKLEYYEIKTLYELGFYDVITLAEYIQSHDIVTIAEYLSKKWHGPNDVFWESLKKIRHIFSNFDYFEFLRLMNLPKLRNCELKVIALRMSGYTISDTEMKYVRRKAIDDFFNDKGIVDKIKSLATPVVKKNLTTIVGKMDDSITIEIKNLPKDFSFAYTFFRNIEQELRLLQKEIDKATQRGDNVTATYLIHAQQFLNEHPKPKNYYVGGCSIPPVLNAIQTLAFHGDLLFSSSVASCVRNRLDAEIAAIYQEYKHCQLIQGITYSSELDNVITIMRDSKSEEEAIEKLRSEMSLNSDEAENIIKIITFEMASDENLLREKIKSMKFLLEYLKHIKSINL